MSEVPGFHYPSETERDPVLPRTMGDPIVLSEPQYEEITAEREQVDLEPFRDFEFDLQTNRLRVAGYSPEEAAEMLRIYREHLRLMAENAQLFMAELSQAAET
jgi:hypothetical protein